MKPILGIDIETYSPVPLPKTGVYRYVDSDEFEILLFSYAYDDGPVYTVDLASGERLPDGVLEDLENPEVIKAAYNAQFERVCLSKYLGHWLDPHQWRCTAVMAAYLTMVDMAPAICWASCRKSSAVRLLMSDVGILIMSPIGHASSITYTSPCLSASRTSSAHLATISTWDATR